MNVEGKRRGAQTVRANTRMQTARDMVRAQESRDLTRTFRTVCSCSAICHSSSSSSYSRRSYFLLAVIASIASRYSRATSSILKVEFQRVRTSRGNTPGSKPHFSTTSCQAGRRIVDELRILYARVRICREVVRTTGTCLCSTYGTDLRQHKLDRENTLLQVSPLFVTHLLTFINKSLVVIIIALVLACRQV